MTSFSVRYAVLLLLFSLCLIARVSAWGDEGHQIIAQLATNMLSDDAYKEMNRLLSGQSLVDVVTEPDAYAHTPQGNWSACLHFVNMGLTQTGYDPSTDCTTLNGVANCCVVAAIANYTKQVQQQVSEGSVVKTSSEDPSQEPVPLAFLSHFVGDCHQPLHIGYTCDEGGNYVDVTIFGQSTNLHSTWDTVMLEHYDSSYYDFASQLQQQLTDNPQLASNFTLDMIASGWANESYSLVRNDCYVFNRSSSASAVTSTYPGTCPLQGVTNLSDGYYNYNIEIVKQRLMAAGVRLATLLNQILVPSSR